METPLAVAIIGGVITILGIIVSGVFGMLNTTTQRQDRLTQDRVAFKDEQLADCEDDLKECRERLEEVEKRLEQSTVDLWEARGRLHAAEVALLEAKTDRGEEHHHRSSLPKPSDSEYDGPKEEDT